MEKRDKYLSMRVTEEELARVAVLAGEEKIPSFVLGVVFNVKRARGSDKAYPGWEVVERNRRDRGIKIARDPAPLGMQSPIILYPEDDAYGQFVE
jgi:hypothetical protein